MRFANRSNLLFSSLLGQAANDEVCNSSSATESKATSSTSFISFAVAYFEVENQIHLFLQWSKTCKVRRLGGKQLSQLHIAKKQIRLYKNRSNKKKLTKPTQAQTEY